MNQEENALIGWEAIATYLGLSYWQALHRSKQLREAGVVYRVRKPFNDRKGPGSSTIRVAALPSMLQRYVAMIAMSGKPL